MAIQKVKRATTDRNGYPASYEDVGEPEYVGCVVGRDAEYNVRKMSDIWADDFYAVVWTGTGTTRVFLGSNFELQDTVAVAEVDATPEVMAAYEAWKVQRAEAARVAAEARREQERLEAIEREKKAVRKGRRVRVVRGRKTPVGTEGVVFWMGNGRVGIALSDRRDASGRNLDVAWVDEDYCEAIPEAEVVVEQRVETAKADWKAARETARETANQKLKAERDAQWAALADSEVPF